MQPDIADLLVEDFERGRLLHDASSFARLLGLGAALTVMAPAGECSQAESSTFQATGLDHVALNVE